MRRIGGRDETRGVGLKKKPDPEGIPAYFDTLSQASGITGIPLQKFRRWKKMGAPGFRGPRLHWDELKPWLEKNAIELDKDSSDEHNKDALTCRLLLEKIRILEIQRSELEGKFMLRSDHEAWQVQKAEQLKANLQDVFKRNLPPKLEGLRAAEIAAEMDKAIVQFVDAFRKAPEDKE